MTSLRELNKIKGLSDAKIDKMLEGASKLEGWTWMSGLQCENQRQKIKRITTGSSRLDEILGGGVEGNSITEVYGEFRTGKSQVCHTMAVACQLPREMGGGNGKAV